jgi:hypothetical protein
MSVLYIEVIGYTFYTVAIKTKAAPLTIEGKRRCFCFINKNDYTVIKSQG